MEYKEKVEEFLNIKNINKRDLATKLNKSESLISRWTNADKPSLEFLLSLAKAFPDLDLNWMLKEASPYKLSDLQTLQVFDTQSDYGKSAMDIITDIEGKLNVLKSKIEKSE